MTPASYSPSQTRLFSRCPYKWYIEKYLHLRPSILGKRDLAACVGTAVGAALATYYKHNRQVEYSTLVGLAQDRYQQEVETHIKAGRSIYDEETAIAYSGYPLTLLNEYMKNESDHIPADFTVTDVESRMCETHESYIDIGGTCDRGRWIADFKCRMNVKPGSVEAELNKYAFDSQLLQYVDEYQKKTNQPVAFYRIIMLVAAPKPMVRWQDFEVSQHVVNARAASNTRIWSDIHVATQWLAALDVLDRHARTAVVEAVPMAADHYDGIFKCEYTDVCFGDYESPADSGTLINIGR
ncbi:pD-(D/E)xk nuclease superfamily [Caudoviricetes sp.]|nr:pD-(D/E)xk nuclease superfamily [Caudoviricetes sp.]UOF79639.1 pD-(D/E)xk nuclease superfamily [Caudoviricetes sp.]UOF79827.1 pD-(D/E)xk nuclease superfamily [Bacteriophage sp.]UOF81310.1 pD-(D/E)xk nuclease superfamily [Caudoviricetes sp.]